MSPVLGDEDLGRHDDLEAANAALTAALERIEHLERQLALGTVTDLRYWLKPAGSKLVVKCPDCRGADATIDVVGGVRLGMLHALIAAHERDRHGAEQPVPAAALSGRDVVATLGVLQGVTVSTVTYPLAGSEIGGV